MVLVIAMFIIVGAYVGYHASQEVPEEGKAHNITTELEIPDESSGLVQILQKPELRKTIL